MNITLPPSHPVPRLRSYVVTTFGKYERVVAAFSAGQAKSFASCDVLECGGRYTDIRARLAGSPLREPVGFRSCADYRGFPWVKIGQRVRVAGFWGHIVGHNSSANWNVLPDGKRHVLNCHPRSEIAYYDDSGKLIEAYNLRGEKESAS